MTLPSQEPQVLSHSETQTSHPGNPRLRVHAYSVVWEALPTPWTVACQDPLSMGYRRQEYWSGLPVPTLGDLPHSGIEPVSPALAGGLFITEPPGKTPWGLTPFIQGHRRSSPQEPKHLPTPTPKCPKPE